MFNFFRRPKILTFEQIRAETDRLRALIGAPDNVCPLLSSSFGDGSPFLRIVADGYIYANEERGHVYNERKTQDLDELLYWIMKDITFSMRWITKSQTASSMPTSAVCCSPRI